MATSWRVETASAGTDSHMKTPAEANTRRRVWNKNCVGIISSVGLSRSSVKSRDNF